jgi:SAM-dependent methyltransferase
MEIQQFRNMETYLAERSRHWDERWAVEKLIARAHPKRDESWHQPGFCQACRQAALFLIDWQVTGPDYPNYRERLVCPHCGLNNRQRFMAAFFRRVLDESGGKIRDVYLYEQVTAFYHWLTGTFPDLPVQASEFLGFEYKSGDVVNGIRHEDALALSFADESLDVILSNDVYEHVPNIHPALSEARRVLRPGGKLLITTPFFQDTADTVQRAILAQGKLVHMHPEVYHGNPVSEKGSLVFYDYGWDILDFCRRAGFSDAYVLGYYSMFYGYMGGAMQPTIVAVK